MYCKMKYAFVLSFFTLLFFTPAFISGSGNKVEITAFRSAKSNLGAIANASAELLYDSLNLENAGLNEKAFEYAWKGFLHLAEKGKLLNTDYITICDYSQSSRNKRLYIIDLADMKLLKNTYVAHGRNSGGEFAQSFSNRPESHKSSLGFYVTGKTYTGRHGLSLEINGLEKGINDKALARKIVMHGSSYVSENFLENNPFIGRSYGCPAVPSKERDEIINIIKEGSCLFIYHPSIQYLTKSKILNG